MDACSHLENGKQSEGTTSRLSIFGDCEDFKGGRAIRWFQSLKLEDGGRAIVHGHCRWILGSPPSRDELHAMHCSTLSGPFKMH